MFFAAEEEWLKVSVEILETREIPDQQVSDVQSFLGARVVAVQNGEQESQMRLEYGFVSSYGRTRRCIKVRRPGESVILTFLGGDLWGQTGRVFAKLRKDTGSGYIQKCSKIDPRLEEFETCRLRRVIEPRPGRRVEACWAMAADEDDLATMVGAAMIYEKILAC